MLVDIPDAPGWAKENGARLRRLQAGCADLPAEQRRGHLLAEVESLVGGLPQERKRKYLNALLEHFPVMPNAVASPAGGAGSPGESLTEMADRLLEAASHASPEEREELVKKLATGGLAPKAKSARSYLGAVDGLIAVEPKREQEAALNIELLQFKLNLDAEKPLELSRLVALFSALADSFGKLDDMIWGVWRKLAPGSRLQPPGIARGSAGFSGRLAGYLTGEAGESSAFAATLDPTVRLVLAVVNALALGGRGFAKQHLQRIAPEDIEREVRKHAGRFLTGVEEKCWAAFVEVMQDLTPNVLEQELHEAVALAAEELYHSGGK